MVDPRLAEGKRAEFNVNFAKEKTAYGIALRNGIIAITAQLNKGPGFDMTKNEWDQLIVGEKTFASLGSPLSVIDQAIGR